jgi:type IV secretory pathway VirB10-like protein
LSSQIKLFLSLFTYCLLAIACNKKNIPAKTSDVKGQPMNFPIPPPQMPNVATPPVVPENPVGEKVPMIYLKKTPCFGKCPVFEVKIQEDGSALWVGTKNVERIGTFSAQISKETLEEIMKEAEKIQYFSFSETYPTNGKKIADFPMTISSINSANGARRIENNFDAPIALQAFEQYLFEKMDKLDWK